MSHKGELRFFSFFLRVGNDNNSIPDLFHIIKNILNNSTLPSEVYEINQARKWAYKEDGSLAYDCSECEYIKSQKIRLGCQHITDKDAVDCKFKHCPGYAISSDFVPEFYELLQMVDNIQLINLYKYSNILFEVALLEHHYKLEQMHEMQVNNGNR